eukprot:19137-Heterococcus_DN1.PRE.1
MKYVLLCQLTAAVPVPLSKLSTNLLCSVYLYAPPVRERHGNCRPYTMSYLVSLRLIDSVQLIATATLQTLTLHHHFDSVHTRLVQTCTVYAVLRYALTHMSALTEQLSSAHCAVYTHHQTRCNAAAALKPEYRNAHSASQQLQCCNHCMSAAYAEAPRKGVHLSTAHYLQQGKRSLNDCGTAALH